MWPLEGRHTKFFRSEEVLFALLCSFSAALMRTHCSHCSMMNVLWMWTHVKPLSLSLSLGSPAGLCCRFGHIITNNDWFYFAARDLVLPRIWCWVELGSVAFHYSEQAGVTPLDVMLLYTPATAPCHIIQRIFQHLTQHFVLHSFSAAFASTLNCKWMCI